MLDAAKIILYVLDILAERRKVLDFSAGLKLHKTGRIHQIHGCSLALSILKFFFLNCNKPKLIFFQEAFGNVCVCMYRCVSHQKQKNPHVVLSVMTNTVSMSAFLLHEVKGYNT